VSGPVGIFQPCVILGVVCVSHTCMCAWVCVYMCVGMDGGSSGYSQWLIKKTIRGLSVADFLKCVVAALFPSFIIVNCCSLLKYVYITPLLSNSVHIQNFV
jgi:hypothetical protein